jgi:hypothetical protein
MFLPLSFGLVFVTPPRPRPQLSQPDSIDRDVLSHCLLLSEALLDCLSEQQQHQPSLPPRLAQLCVAEVQQQEAGRQGSLRDALQVCGSELGMHALYHTSCMIWSLKPYPCC